VPASRLKLSLRLVIRAAVFHFYGETGFSRATLYLSAVVDATISGGDAGALYDCITQRLFTLPDETLVYPGHDYQGRWVSSIKQERTTNPRLAGKTR